MVGDIRDQLNQRLRELRQTEGRDAMWVREGAAPRSANYERASRNLAELREVEATLATMQLADAQLEVAKAQREVAAQQRHANDADAMKRSKAEDSAFWARRFLTSITVANVGALVAVLVFMSKPDSPLVPTSSTTMAVRLFMVGTLLGGFYPVGKIFALWLWNDQRRPLAPRIIADIFLPAVAAAALFAGSWISIQAVFDVYEQRVAAVAVGPDPLGVNEGR